jgi:hypothetical protein
MHIPVRWQFLQLAQVLPSPDSVGQRFTATHVSTWLMASGHVLRTQKELFPEITVGGGTYGLISQQTTGVICTAIVWPSKHHHSGQQLRRGRKTLLTLENCGELDSLLRSGFSRSIGKTDNTQRKCPRASAIRRPLFHGTEQECYKGSRKWKNKAESLVLKIEKPQLCGFSYDGHHWPPKGPRQIMSAGSRAPVCGWS